MAQVTKTVDKTLVNGSETFIYTVDVSYSGLSLPAQSGLLTDFFPSKIQYQLPPIGGQIQNIIQTPAPGGTNVTFDFGEVNAGTSLSFTIAAHFGPGRVDNDSFTNVGLLFADDLQVAMGTAPTVHLILTENFRLIKQLVDPAPVKPGQELTFQLILVNQGDVGATITNVSISDILPPQLIPVASFLPVGTDSPMGGYSDPTYNGRTGSWSGSTLNFTLPSYHGARYQVTFKATVADTVTPGERFVNTATWTLNGTAQENADITLTVFSNSDNFSLNKSGTRTGYIGSPLFYTIVNSNQGGVPLTEYQIEDFLPDEVDITQLRFNSLVGGLPDYSIFITVSGSSLMIPIVEHGSGNTPLINLLPFLPAGDRVVKVLLTAAVLNAVNSSHTLNLYGAVNGTAVQNQTITNTAIASAVGVQSTSLWATLINGASDLSIQKRIEPEQPAYFPLEEFQFVLAEGAPNTFTVNPIFGDLLPLGIQYVLNSEYFVYTDQITGITYDSRAPGFPVPLPTREIIEDFDGTGRKFIRWSFLNFTLPMNDMLLLYFTAFVEISPPNQFTNIAYLGNPGKNVLFVYDAIADVRDYDGDGITDEMISSDQVSGVILTTSEFSIKKLVKGQLDLDYSPLGNTIAGGDVDYQLLITNNQALSLKDIELVDILPWVGDTGVILTDTPRGSQFTVYATGAVTAEIVNVLGNPVDPNPEIFIAYSTSNDPMRFDQLGNPIGTGTWSPIPPADITTLRSVRVITGANVILKPYERLIVTLHAKAPVGAPVGLTAYNSFAVRASKIGATIEPLLPTEPNKVGVRISAADAGSIGQFVWVDYNGDGIFEPGEPGVNGIIVELYDANKALLSTTVTANHFGGFPGYYLFSGLPAGNYFVKFIPYGVYVLTQQRAGEINGSKPNPVDGFTDLIPLLAGEQRTDINAGVLGSPCAPPVIDAKNRCIFVNEPFDPMFGVTATDCLGQDITSAIIIVQNTVNNQMPGLYSVTYQVTDQRGQTTSKTILVRVVEAGPHHQAVSDLIESVALEQAALSHILNAEGEKIQRAVALDATPEQLLATNKSVRKMVHKITLLEMILQRKLSVVDCQICGEDCCNHCVSPP